MEPFLIGAAAGAVLALAVAAHGDVIEVRLSEGVGGSSQSRRSLVTGSGAPGLVAQLEGWCAIRLPLLLTIDASGDGQLSGPEATATGFREVVERV